MMLVIFDFDGTLADTWDLFAEELAAGAARFRYRRLSRDELADMRRLDTKAFFRTLGVRWWRLPRLVAHLRRRAAALTDRAKLFPGVGDLITTLDVEGHTLALASSNAEPAVRAVLGAELSSHFRYFACSSSLFGKAAKFRNICRRTGVPASATIAVGDETRDLEAADAAGIASVAVEWGYHHPAILRAAAPGRTAASPAELCDMLRQFSKSRRFR